MEQNKNSQEQFDLYDELQDYYSEQAAINREWDYNKLTSEEKVAYDKKSADYQKQKLQEELEESEARKLSQSEYEAWYKEKHSKKNVQPSAAKEYKFMSKSNSVIVGRVVKLIEQTDVNDKTVSKFLVVVDSKEKDNDGKPKDETFYNVEVWNKNYGDTLSKMLVLGESVMLNGQLVIDTYEKNGQKNTSVKVLNPEVTCLGKIAKNAASTQKIFVAGRLTKDVELVQVNDKGDKVAKFSLAENYGEDLTNFYDVELWNSKAENIQKHIGKGSLIKVNGDLQIKPFEHNGNKLMSIKIVNGDISFLSKSANRAVTEEKNKTSASKKENNNTKGK